MNYILSTTRMHCRVITSNMLVVVDDKQQVERGCEDQIAQRLPQCPNASVVHQALKHDTPIKYCIEKPFPGKLLNI